MGCCEPGIGLLEGWYYLFWALVVALFVWVVYKALIRKRRGISFETNFVCADCGERLKSDWNMCPKCGKAR